MVILRGNLVVEISFFSLYRARQLLTSLRRCELINNNLLSIIII